MKFKIPKMNDKQTKTYTLLNILTMLFTAFVVLSTLFNWKITGWIIAPLLLAMSAWLISQGGLKAIKNPRERVHLFSLAVGAIAFFIAIATIPLIGALLFSDRFEWLIVIIFVAAMITSLLEIFI